MRLSKMLPPAYVQGYTAALQDVLEQLDCADYDIKFHKLRPASKAYKGVVKCMLDNRTVLREVSGAFVRWNTIKKDFEVWVDQAKTEAEANELLGRCCEKEL